MLLGNASAAANLHPFHAFMQLSCECVFLFTQDIFECKTCGLTGTLCCCTECARVCHKGHECK